MRFRESRWSKDIVEVTEFSSFFATRGRAKGGGEAQTFRNANAVYMKIMNFRRFDPEYAADGKVGPVRGGSCVRCERTEFSRLHECARGKTSPSPMLIPST
jgi:hypothetical protein